MTVNTAERKAGPYVGNGTLAQYSFAFKVLDATQIRVVEANASGFETELTHISNFTVVLNPNQDTSPGGTVTRTAGNLPFNYRWTILSRVPYGQSTDLPPGGLFSAVVIETGLDKLAMQVQQVAEQASRSVAVPPTSSQSAEALVADLLAARTVATASATAAAGSATAAAASATAAGTSETNAAASATAAGTSETNAAASATNAGNSATAAATSATNAANSATAAATSATNAGNSATAAATSATNAANSATAAGNSATAADNSATAAAVGNGGRYSATVGGTANAITLTPTPALMAYTIGEAITFIVAAANTGAVTVNVSGLGAKAVTKRGSTPLESGFFTAGQLVTLRYDGTQYQVVTPSAAIPPMNVPHTWAVSGEIKVPSGNNDVIPGFFVPTLSPGQTVKLVQARHKIGSGTSATVKLQKNGVDIADFTNISVTTTAAGVSAPAVALVAGDYIQLVPTAVSGTPYNMSFTVSLQYSVV